MVFLKSKFMNDKKYIWFNGKLVPWHKANIHVLSHALHYGTGAFEGIRFYNTKKGVAIFQLDRHLDRWLYSSKCLRMKLPFTKMELKKAVIKVILVNKLTGGYVRPISFYGHGPLRVDPTGLPVEVVIAAWPWGSYFGEKPAKLKLSSFVRLHPRSSFADAKITGHYVNAMLAVTEAKNKGFTEAVMLDYEGNVAEGSADNIFIVKNKVVYTPSLGKILAGITRESVITLAKDLGYKMVEKKLTMKDLYSADECFITGTAAEISPVGQIEKIKLKNSFGPVTKHFRQEFQKIILAENSKYKKWLTFVK